MSSILWKGDYLFQHLRDYEEELGYVELDQNSNTCVLRLKDTFGVVAGSPGGYIRGDEFPSMAFSKQNAASSASAFILHCIWMRNVAKKQVSQAVDNHWDEISKNLPGDTNKDDLFDKLRTHLDRLTIEKVKDLSEKVLTGVGVHAIVELLKKLP